MHSRPFRSEQPQVCSAHRVGVSEVQPALVQGVNSALMQPKKVTSVKNQKDENVHLQS